MQNMVAEQKLRTQRIIGRLLQEMEKNKGGNPKLTSHKQGQVGKLSDLGITRNQSSTFQTIANLPEERFESYIAEKKAAVNDAVAELTTSGALKLADGKDKS